MDTTLLTTLSNLETALTSLTESITTSSPATPLSQTLLQTNTHLTKNLTQLHQHTENILTIAHLHSLAAHLAETYKRQISTLSELRAEITRVNVSGPTTTTTTTTTTTSSSSSLQNSNSSNRNQERPDTAASAVDYKTLLAFARSVSLYTAPRGFKPPSVLRAEAEAKGNQELRGGGEGVIANVANAANGVEVGGSGGGGGGANGLQAEGEVTAERQGQQGVGNNNKEMGNRGIESLVPDIKAWLDPQLQVPFLPWPSEGMVARSGLARISGWVGAVGIEDDAGTAEQAREAEEETLRKKEEEQKAAAARYDDYEQQQVRSAPKPKVFTGLDLYDPDEE